MNTPMNHTTIGDGFLPYHFEINVRPDRALTVKEHIKSWKARFRDGSILASFPEGLMADIQALGGVSEVIAEGPQSSVLIPLRMIKAAKDGNECLMSSTVGTGAVAVSIRSALETWGIGLDAKVIEDGDSPLEFSIRDGLVSESLRMYPCSRTRFKKRFQLPEGGCERLIVNRCNQGLKKAMQAVFEQGGHCSLRMHNIDRHTKASDYIEMIPWANSVIISTRNRVLNQVAAAFELKNPLQRMAALAEALATIPAAKQAVERPIPTASRMITLIEDQTGLCHFYQSDQSFVTVKVPSGYDLSSRAARIQGAFLSRPTFKQEGGSFENYCEGIIQGAYQGTESRPWGY